MFVKDKGVWKTQACQYKKKKGCCWIAKGDMIGFDNKEKGKGKNGKENAEAPSHSATE